MRGGGDSGDAAGRDPGEGGASFAAELTRLEDAIWCRERCRELALRIGFDEADAWRVSIAVSELVTNAVGHGGGGRLRATEVRLDAAGLEIVVEDRGPGIARPDLALADGFSRGRFLDDEVWVHRRVSLGSGLGAARRMMDEIVIGRGEGGGARVVARKWLTPARGI